LAGLIHDVIREQLLNFGDAIKDGLLFSRFDAQNLNFVHRDPKNYILGLLAIKDKSHFLFGDNSGIPVK
jgi:hypothetical protein